MKEKTEMKEEEEEEEEVFSQRERDSVSLSLSLCSLAHSSALRFSELWRFDWIGSVLLIFPHIVSSCSDITGY